jgi:hypothetical protein
VYGELARQIPAFEEIWRYRSSSGQSLRSIWLDCMDPFPMSNIDAAPGSLYSQSDNAKGPLCFRISGTRLADPELSVTPNRVENI